MRYLPLLAFVLAAPAAAQEKPDPARLKASVEKLVAFGTRHTLSSQDDPARGIGAARAWGGAEMTRIADACGGCIVVSNIARTMVSPRTPQGANIVDVLGFQQGSDPKRVVIVAAHIDSRVTDVMDAKTDAPGANDNGSGSALVLEAARLLSKEKFRATIIYALLSGEEQGLARRPIARADREGKELGRHRDAQQRHRRQLDRPKRGTRCRERPGVFGRDPGVRGSCRPDRPARKWRGG